MFYSSIFPLQSHNSKLSCCSIALGTPACRYTLGLPATVVWQGRKTSLWASSRVSARSRGLLLVWISLSPASIWSAGWSQILKGPRFWPPLNTRRQERRKQQEGEKLLKASALRWFTGAPSLLQTFRMWPPKLLVAHSSLNSDPKQGRNNPCCFPKGKVHWYGFRFCSATNLYEILF